MGRDSQCRAVLSPVRSGTVGSLKSKDGKESYKGGAHQYELLIGFRVQNNLPTIILTVSPIIYMITVFYWLKFTKTTATNGIMMSIYT